MTTTNVSRVRTLVECALMIALATILSELTFFKMPFGGNVTIFSMLPLVLVSFRHGIKWGMLTSITYSVLQLILGLGNFSYLISMAAIIGCLFFDYILAYSCLGTAVFFGKNFKNKVTGFAVGTAVVCFFRFICSYFSGVLVWGSSTPDGWNVWGWSLAYNGAYMLPELILTTIGAVLIGKFVLPRMK